eukprot:2182169-Pyramimonas_sp.AAC.1
MKIMGWLASICAPTRCSAGSTKAGPNMTSVTGTHSAMLLAVTMAGSFAPTGAGAPRRPPFLREGKSRGPSLVTE